MAKMIRVEFLTKVPDGISDELIQEWLDFALNYRSSIKITNPLINKEIFPRSTINWYPLPDYPEEGKDE